jgi:hypothetical protein
MISIDELELDDLLNALPPPPVDTDTAEETKKEEIEAIKFLFIGPVEKDGVIVRENKRHTLISTEARCIPSSAKNRGVLLKLNCTLSTTTVYRSPIYIQKSGLHYPVKTSICCWWCRSKFTTQPIGIPSERTTRGAYVCVGNYCSFECCLAGANDSKSRRLQLFAGTNLCIMRKLISGKKLSAPLYPAPHWSALKSYGGRMTLKEFRSGVQCVTAIPENLRLFPVGFNIFAEKRKIATKRPRTTNLVHDANNLKKLCAPKKKKNKLYKTNFSHTKLTLMVPKSKTRKLRMKTAKKKKKIRMTI